MRNPSHELSDIILRYFIVGWTAPIAFLILAVARHVRNDPFDFFDCPIEPPPFNHRCCRAFYLLRIHPLGRTFHSVHSSLLYRGAAVDAEALAAHVKDDVSVSCPAVLNNDQTILSCPSRWKVRC